MTTPLTDPRRKAGRDIQAFREQFGQPHLDLACHAAFPMALTPDLLYRLWAHFRRDVSGQPLPIPWVAVADILLAPFCQEVGFELYEIETPIRQALLDQLQADPRFGLPRLQELANFLLTYYPAVQLYGDDLDLRDLAQAQRWSAQSQTNPAQVVRNLAQTLARGTAQDGAEWGRMAELIRRLHLPTGEEAQTLLHYAQGMATLARGEPQTAWTHFRQLPGRGRRSIQIGGVSLSIPPEIQQQALSPSGMSRRRWLQWAGWGAVGVAGTVGAALLIRRDGSTPAPPEVLPSTLQRQDVLFPIQVVTVDPQGAVVERQPQQVPGVRWQQGAEGTEFALEVANIPAGEFVMGSPETEAGRLENEGPQHRVRVPAFSMGCYPVTQAQWRFVAALPKINRDLEPEPSYFKGDDRPVEQVSWYEAVEFCDRLSALLGTPCRLPSEAEWECACRAGTTTPFHFGETITTDLANYNGGSIYGDGPQGVFRGETTAVGSFPPNAFGLYDMHGNVWEWCADHWHENYQGAPTDGSAWLLSDERKLSASYVLRGGSWDLNPVNCRSAYRDWFIPGDQNDGFGFRVVCSPPRTPL